jgi:uncharacterized protein (TIGR02246 family)
MSNPASQQQSTPAASQGAAGALNLVMVAVMAQHDFVYRRLAMASVLRSHLLFTLVWAIPILCSTTAWADTPAAEHQAAITKKAQAFVEAFAKGDAQAVAAFWTPDGDYIDLDGHALMGRKAIADHFAQFFASNKGLKLRIDVQSTRFPTPDTAIETGTSSVIPADGPVSRACYTNFLVKKDGEWMLASVRDSDYVPPSQYEHLRPIEWLIGEWVEDTKESHVGRILFEWTPGQNYIVASRAVGVGELVLDNGSERLAWDPAAKSFRSWNFNADGSFSQGSWKSDGDKWVITTTAVLPSGAVATATSILARPDANALTLQTRIQKPGSKTPTDMPVVKMKRAQ